MERERDITEQAHNEQVKFEQAAESHDYADIGPTDALPAWRPFYAAVRDAMRKLREQ
ncbi:hypothetical protein D3C84_1275890 [compost metagenome]